MNNPLFFLGSSPPQAWTLGAPESEEELADRYMEKIEAALNDQVIKKIPRTAGANGTQGRKPKWRSPTKAIRIPAKYADRLVALARKWEAEERAGMEQAWEEQNL